MQDKNNLPQNQKNSKENQFSNFTFSPEINQFFDAISQSTDDILYICQVKTGLIRYSKELAEEFDLPTDPIYNPLPYWEKIVHPDDWERFQMVNIETFQGTSEYHVVEFRAKTRLGQWVWIQCRGRMLRDKEGNPDFFAGFLTNMDKRNKIDYKTGLYNRFVFEKNIKIVLANANISKMSLIILGVDDFANINERYDHDFGDSVLYFIAQRIQSILPGNASIYRLSGDQFGLIITNSDQKEVRELYDTMKTFFSAPQYLGDKQYHSSLSAGCAFYPKDSNHYLDLLKFAETALFHSKKNGKNQITFYSKDLSRQRERYIELIERFRESINDHFHGFYLVYQPQIHGRTKKLIGVEALIRWNHPQTGPVSPGEFIPYLESSGLILPVGKWIFQQAVNTCKRFLKYWPDLTISINLSYLQLEEPGFLAYVNSIIEKSGISPRHLVIELTETCLATNLQEARMILQNFRLMGIRIAMDDFGTGYSSLSVLKEAPADVVKVDQSFVRGVEQSKFNENFIRFITIVCHDAQIEVCLEGVETTEEFDVVKEMDIDCVQGYLFGKPQSEKELIQNFYIEPENQSQ